MIELIETYASGYQQDLQTVLDMAMQYVPAGALAALIIWAIGYAIYSAWGWLKRWSTV